MGYDITYHPISEEDLQQFVVKVVANPDVDNFRPLLRELTMEAEDQEFIESGIYSRFPDFRRKIEKGRSSPKSTTGFAAAALAGYLYPYWYCRNGSLSFLCEEEPEFASFVNADGPDVRDDLRRFFTGAFSPMTDHYQAGVYVPADKVYALKLALEDDMYSSAVSEHIGYRNYDTLMAAIGYCLEHKLGLLEATDIFVPISGETSTYHENLRAPYLKNIHDFNNSRKVLYRPVDFNDCLGYINGHRDQMERGIVDVRIERRWLDRFDRGTYDFLLKHSKNVKILVAKHAGTSPEVLEQLAFDRSVVAYDGEDSTCHDHFLAIKVAKNPATPDYVLEKIHAAYPELATLHLDLARHQNAPTTLLERLARHPDAEVRSEVISNPNTTHDILRLLRNDTEKQNRVRVFREMLKKKSSPLWFRILFFPVILPLAIVILPLVFPWQYFRRNRDK